MAEYGEWGRKNATLSEVTAQAEYGVSRNFIIKGIKRRKLEFRDGAIWGNPYVRILRSQLEAYIEEECGSGYLSAAKNDAKLRKLTKEIAAIKKTLRKLEARKATLEGQSKDK